mgnify:CR=1 FL=1
MKGVLQSSIERGKRVRFIVKGNSMYPFIKAGEKVEIERVGKIRIGDVVLLKRKNEFLLHRVLFVFRNFVITKGDRSPFIDHPSQIKNVIGKVRKEEGFLKIFRTIISILSLPLSYLKFVLRKK